MQALDDNGIWELVPLPSREKDTSCCRVFAENLNPDGSIARLKVRLVSKGYAQNFGVDYSDTFSLVAKLASVRMFIFVVASYDWDLH